MPRVSQKVNKHQIGHASSYHHPGAMKNNFTNQMNVSIGSMSDSLNSRILSKKAAAVHQRKRSSHFVDGEVIQ